jgi:hypothetical protein
MLFLDNGPSPWSAKCKLNSREVTSSAESEVVIQPWCIVCHTIISCQIGSAHVQHLKKFPDHVFWQCQRFTKGRKNLTKGLLKRWNMLLLKVNMILTSTDPSDVYVLEAFINAIKKRM